ncbi:DUF3742 family protein [Burkholderia sola]|uniref:DUF3742 family protein n=1 Tax=Burkholderia TaxID=32008 RepID=UPI001AE9B00F|nr:DUF3742 family protein [Burkholderia sp. AcTa6-5]MBP0714286.1 DUF3742 family protein [Burkholderia sp. AcTa6-5]
MKTTKHTSIAERFGRRLGRGWRAYARGERRASNWLVSKGMPLAGAAVLVWAVKLAVLGVLLYTTFWLALLLVFVMVLARAADKSSLEDDEKAEWRVGWSGYGLYRGETRVDPGQDDDA